MAQSRRILILGGGFGGVYCAKELESRLPKDAEVEIVLISEQNFLVFTPMLPQVISGMIESNHVVVPIRQILKRTKFQEASITSIDVQEKRVSVEIDEGHAGEQSRQVMSFDHLVVALGSATNFAGMPRINDHVFVLKNLKDALKLRNHIIDMLE
ncbi:MAG TPA: FAD-dependent oxidoreductase, partial [Nitrososphaera sp.]|nr:FAD-dependent oxidoreductase [Nitrososphaera sp.]